MASGDPVLKSFPHVLPALRQPGSLGPRPLRQAALHSPSTDRAPNPGAAPMKADTTPPGAPGGRGEDLKWELPHS